MLSDISILSNETNASYPLLDSRLPFSQYILQCRLMIEERRQHLFPHQFSASQVIAANSPFELYPDAPLRSANRIKYGALLIHGLWDSPFSCKEIGERLQQNGILSRAILLPGHGTRPSDLQQVTYQDWIQLVRYGTASLQQEVEQVFLIGFSAGATLSIYQALEDDSIAGTVLLAPAIRIQFLMDMVFSWHHLMKWLSKNKQWIYLEDEIDYAKYKSIAFNPALQIYQLTRLIAKKHQQRSLQCPIFMSISEDDETISSQAAIKFFLNSPHELSRLLLYSNHKSRVADKRLIQRHSNYPELDIENFSHVCLPFSADNVHYGQRGDYINASRPNNTISYGAYNRVSERFYRPFYQMGILKKYKKELTYNPDFNFLADEIVKFIISSA